MYMSNAGRLVQGTGFGIVGEIIIGVPGAFIGRPLLPRLGIHLGSSLVTAIAGATIVSVVLLAHPARSRRSRPAC
jgi:uncharacterized membrane protein YeaQ/YmgE (transglycosylase-associated protein family)